MSRVHLQVSSFNAGELSPLLGSRFGVEKVAAGCRRLRNFFIHTHGPAFRRPGMEYMGAAASNVTASRLLGFNFSTETGAILEFYDGGMRVWSNGGLVPLANPVVLPYTARECSRLQAAQVNDVVYLVHPNHAPRKLVRYADNDWRVSEIAWKYPPVGEENVPSDEIRTPLYTEQLSISTRLWTEWDIPAGTYHLMVIDRDAGTTTSRTAKVQGLNTSTGEWVDKSSITWSDSDPLYMTFSYGNPRKIRIVYEGPVTNGTERVGVGTSPLVTPSMTLRTYVPQPTSERFGTVPAGDWQVKVFAGEKVPAGAKVTVQTRNVGGSTWGTVKEITDLAPNKTSIYRGATLASPKEVRLVWSANSDLGMAGGTAKVDSIEVPTDTTITLTPAAVTGSDVTLTASSALFDAGHVGSYWRIGHRRETAFVAINSAVTTIAAESSATLRVQGAWQLTTYGIWETTLYLEKKINGVWSVMRSWEGKKDRNISVDGDEENLVEMRLRVAAGTSVAATNNAAPRFVLEALDATVYGLVKITSVTNSTTAKCSVISTLNATTATPHWAEGSWSNDKGYPRAIATHGGRLWFAGTESEPMRIWGSAVNDYENFRQSSMDDAAVSFIPASEQSNAIHWLETFERELLIGTSGNEWTLGTDQGPITPTNVLVQRRSSYGSEYWPASGANGVVLFVQRGGRKLRQISPRSDSVAWSAIDLNVLSEHLGFEGLRQVAVQSVPFTIIWVVTQTGKLLGMTYEAEQNVFGWHVHETAGTVESVAVVNRGDVDEVWLEVNRDNGRGIERMDSKVFQRDFSEPKRMIYLDAAVFLSRDGTPYSSLSNLTWLEGKEVAILGDGVPQASRTVTSGAITLETPANTVVVGLPYTSELQPMRMEIPMRDGTSQGRVIRVNRVLLALHDSRGGQVADATTGVWETIKYPSGTALFTGETESAVTSQHRSGVDVAVRTSAPLPLNVGAIVVKGDLYGE